MSALSRRLKQAATAALVAAVSSWATAATSTGSDPHPTGEPAVCVVVKADTP